MSEPSPTPPEPAQEFSLLQMIPTLFFDVAMPIILYNLLTHYGAPVLWALVAGGLSPAFNNLRTWIKSRRLEPLGIIVMTFLAIGTAASLISGSVFFALVKDSFLTGTFGAICLASLFAKRPLLFYIVRQFAAGNNAARIEWWNGLWQITEFRRGMRFVTAVWGIAYIIEALARVGFALVLAPGQVVAISPVMGFGVLIVLIAWTRRYMQAIRDRRAEEAAA